MNGRAFKLNNKRILAKCISSEKVSLSERNITIDSNRVAILIDNNNNCIFTDARSEYKRISVTHDNILIIAVPVNDKFALVAYLFTINNHHLYKHAVQITAEMRDCVINAVKNEIK